MFSASMYGRTSYLGTSVLQPRATPLQTARTLPWMIGRLHRVYLVNRLDRFDSGHLQLLNRQALNLQVATFLDLSRTVCHEGQRAGQGAAGQEPRPLLDRALWGCVVRARNLEHPVVSRSHSECRARIECTCFRASELRGQFPRLEPKQSESLDALRAFEDSGADKICWISLKIPLGFATRRVFGECRVGMAVTTDASNNSAACKSSSRK